MARFIYKTVTWRLTACGWLTVIAAFTICGVLIVTRLHNFLAIQCPVASNILVVSGTVPDTALQEIIDVMQGNSSLLVLTVGGPISRGSHLSSYRDYANLAAATLRQIASPASNIVAIPAPPTRKDRVFASALALRNWLIKSDIHADSVNIYTLGVRGRRTLILFEEALGTQVHVGVVSLADPDYDPSEWWSTSEGFRTVTSELIAYVYVKTLFRPNYNSN